MRKNFFGVFGEIDSLPGCSQIGVSHSVFVPPENRGLKQGSEAHRQRLEYMKQELGYDYALCTVDVKNTAQLAILARHGWTRLSSFESRKTGNTVALYGKAI